ncbi:MAG: hypothetical protein K2X27_09870 [Candidatus Obscuribacterales bacterium]|nr:hypothetical protein [Candidatus Obscuribacterales bacterium]
MLASPDRSSLQALPKVLLHEHLDCSLRPLTMLELWAENAWRVPQNFPTALRHRFASGEVSGAAEDYQAFLAKDASLSLANYVMAIVHHVLPLMQSSERLTRITRERLEDAAADGVKALELRFAPQLHTRDGLSLEEVMDAVIAGCSGSKLHVRLTVCVLRHEDAAMAQRLADLAIAYRQHVGVFDLAGDEKANPGVLRWWAQEALRVREHGIELDIHLWETDEPTDEDLRRLQEYEIRRLGHGMRGDRQAERILEVCPSSNIVTGQVKSLSEHPIDRLLRQGRKVTVNTDGTLFTCSDLSNEYALLNRQFGWGEAEFLAVNKTAIAASSFSAEVKNEINSILENAYRL